MTNKRHTYFEETDYKEWNLDGYYRFWIKNYKDKHEKLDYSAASDKLVKNLQDVIKTRQWNFSKKPRRVLSLLCTDAG